MVMLKDNKGIYNNFTSKSVVYTTATALLSLGVIAFQGTKDDLKLNTSTVQAKQLLLTKKDSIRVDKAKKDSVDHTALVDYKVNAKKADKVAVIQDLKEATKDTGVQLVKPDAKKPAVNNIDKKGILVDDNLVDGSRAVKESDTKEGTYLLLVDNKGKKIGWVSKDKFATTVVSQPTKEKDVINDIKQEESQKTETDNNVKDTVKQDNNNTESTVKTDNNVNSEHGSTTSNTSNMDVSDIIKTQSTKGNHYMKIKDVNDTYDSPNTDDKTKNINTKQQYVDVVDRLVLPNQEVWLKGANDKYYLESNMEDNTGKFLTVDTKDAKEAAAIAGKNVKDIEFMNPGMNSNPLPSNGYVIQTETISTYDATKYATNGNDREQADFINKLKGYRSIAKKYNVLPSIMVAQATVESQHGTSGLAVKDNNLFGVKGTYKGNGSNWSTAEDGANGYYTINASFRSYPNWRESVEDYSNLLANSGLYPGVKGDTDPVSAITKIKNSGYATAHNYVSAIMNIVNKYHLTDLDK